jgi:NAD(P)-dependent dehydrogenase (short-subunit alcohol dehydrogenase family)
MDLMLRGKTAIVTGGGSNIGRAIVLTLAQEGANVGIFDIDEEAAQKVARQIKEEAPAIRCEIYRTDVTDWTQVEASVRKAIDDFGQIHILINSVGWDQIGLFLEQSPELHTKIIRINYEGIINCFRALLPHMVERRYGRIISLSSDAGRIGEYREAVYSGAKAAVIGFSKAIAREVGRYNITVNVVCPGLTIPEGPEAIGTSSMWAGPLADFWTPERREKAARSYPLQRLGTAQDVANVVVFLASDRCAFVTGQTWSVSGGYTMI